MLNIANALKIPGWSSEQELLWLAKHASKSKCIAEIGSWRGRSVRAMADNTDGVIFCIDPWTDDAVGDPGWWTPIEDHSKYNQKDWLWLEFCNNLTGNIGTKVIPIRMFSAYAFEMLSRKGLTFDMIYIDASHDFGHVTGDIKMWRQLLKPNAVFCGHDYNEPTCPEVAPAVNALIPRLHVEGTIWCAV